MADSQRPAITRIESGNQSTFYQVRRTAKEYNSNVSSVASIDPLFFILGTVIIAVIIFFIRAHDATIISEKPGLVTYQSVQPALAGIENITQEINQVAAGTYTTAHSARM